MSEVDSATLAIFLPYQGLMSLGIVSSWEAAGANVRDSSGSRCPQPYVPRKVESRVTWNWPEVHRFYAKLVKWDKVPIIRFLKEKLRILVC
jgi:hypothetical protein